jgi:TolB-like protein/Tfp pilus assembly protein PilF
MLGMPDLDRIVHNLRHRSLWHVLGVYLAGSWIALQVVDVLANTFDMPDWFPGLALGLLVIGVPIVLATGLTQGKRTDDDGGPTPVESSEARREGHAIDEKARVRTWRTAGVAGVSALSLWAVVATGWMVLGAREGDRSAAASIAVLPFDNLGAAESDYFADGIHEDVLTQLSKIGALRVISRTSVLGFRGTTKNAREIGSELNVGAILEGSVRHDRENNRVRLTVQLIDAETDEHLWAEQYDRTLDDVFQIQSELALRIARELRTALDPDERRRIADRPSPTSEAYDLVLRGREVYGGSVDQNRVAIQLFRQATVADSTSAEAWAELANAFAQQIQLGGAPREWGDSAVIFGERAVRLDPELAVAHKALGMAYSWSGREDESPAEYRRALELNPNYVMPLINLSSRLWNRGECDEGIRFASRARSLSPLDPYPAGHMADHNACLGRSAEASRWLDAARALSPDWIWADYFEALYLLSFGRLDQADSVARAFLSRDPTEPVALLVAGEVALMLGDLARAGAYGERLVGLAPDWRFGGGTARASANILFSSVAAGDTNAGQSRVEEIISLREAEGRGGNVLPILYAVTGNLDAAIRSTERVSTSLRGDEIRAYEMDPRLAVVRDDPQFLAALTEARARIAAMRARVEAWEAEQGKVQ